MFLFRRLYEHTIDAVAEFPDPLLPARLCFSPIVAPNLIKEYLAEYPLKP